MKKIILLILITSISIIKCYSQVAYYDAGVLKTMLDSNNHFGNEAISQKTLFALLNKRYGVGSSDFIKIKTDSTYNPFLYAFFNHAIPPIIIEKNIVASDVFYNTITSVGNANVTGLAGAVSSFLVKRAKEELFISIIQKLQDSTKFPEFQILFPKTMALMKNFNAWEYSNVLNTLKAAFEKDLQQLLVDIPNLTNLPNLDTTGMPKATIKKIDSTYSKAVIKRVIAIKQFLNSPDQRVLISAMRIGGGVINGEKVPDIIHAVSGDKFMANIPGEKIDVTNTIKFLDIISFSLRNQAIGKNYIAVNDLKVFFADKIQRNIYLGLLYQQMIKENIQFTGVNIPALATFLKSDSLKKYVGGLVQNGEDLDTAMFNLSKAKKKGEKDLSTYWSAIFQSADGTILSLSDLTLLNTNLVVPAKIDSLFIYTSKTLEIAYDISTSNYSGAVVDIDAIIPAKNNEKEFKELFLKYGSFVANLVEAKSSEDAENAIESVALPVGSYSIKQNATTNISVNGYIGFGKDGNYAKGIYAPIGFSLSTSNFFGLFDKQILPITFFAPLFDVGSIAAYQLNNPNTAGNSTTGATTTSTTVNTSSSNQQIKLSSIFAPGGEIFFEIPRLPFALGTGMRRTPTLSYSSGSTYNTVGARWQWNFTVLIDIPIFTLLNRTKN